MIKSMTGYGRNKALCEDCTVTVEIKSVNSRYLDCGVKINRAYAVMEEKIKRLAASYIARGKVDIYVGLDFSGGEKVELSINREYLEGYLKALESISADYGIKGDITLAALAQKPEIFQTRKADEDMEKLWAVIREVAEGAFAEFLAMREKEGLKLREDLLARLETLEDLRQKLESAAPGAVGEYNQKMAERIRALLAGAPLDENRILTECAVYADKCDITEELVRLESHLEQCREMLDESVPAGRKLDFLMQEMNREINTVGSKCSEGGMIKLVIEAKAELEKIREQIQNIE